MPARPDQPDPGPAIEDGRTRTRAAVANFVRAIAEGRAGEAAAACATNVVWWLPDGAGDSCFADAGRRLMDYFGPQRSPAAPLILVSGDGGTAVVEQMVHAPTSQAMTPVTSVLQLRDGAIVAGRTYADVAAWHRNGENAAPDKGSR